MLPTYKQDLPLITIGVVVLNREWIIERMLASVQSQTYPHDRLFVLVVDGKSKDNTVKVAEQVLAESDFNGYEVIVKESNIPEARNVCIQNMRGDFLLFWDSDVIMESTAVARSLEILKKESVDMVQSCITQVTVDSADEIGEKWQEWETKYPRQEKTRIVDLTGTGNLLISKKVLKQLSFDQDLTFFEDQDFTSRATKQGFKILATGNVIGFDVNSNKPYSSIYAFDMPLKEALRGIRKKGKIQAQNVTACSSSISKAVIKFFLANKRYLFYAGYIPVMILTVVGVLIQNLWLSLIFPLYFLLYIVIQLKKRGFAKGLNVAVRSFIVGIPTTYSLLYYCIKLIFKRPKALSSKPTT
jgi:glycosyltransferase involved in cell wall biosynthesis